MNLVSSFVFIFFFDMKLLSTLYYFLHSYISYAKIQTIILIDGGII
jgi:hypothetical protein